MLETFESLEPIEVPDAFEQPTRTAVPLSVEPSTLKGPPVTPITARRDEQPTLGADDAPATIGNPPFDSDDDLAPEDMTRARPIDDGLLDRMRNEPITPAVTPGARPHPADLNVPYDSLPSLEVRRPYDTCEAAFSERDPVTQLHEGMRERPAPSYRSPSVEDSVSHQPTVRPPPQSSDEPVFTLGNGHRRDEPSGPRPSPRYAAPVPSFADSEPSYPGAANDAYPPPAEPLPSPVTQIPAQDPRRAPPFVMGVQAIPHAPPQPELSPRPMTRPMTPMSAAPTPMHAGHAIPQASPSYPAPPYVAHNPPSPYPHHAVHAHARAHAHGPAHGTGAMLAHTPGGGVMAIPQPSYHPHPHAHAAHTMTTRPQPLAQQPQGQPWSVGRIAWFVAGAAFGITFAFFASGLIGAKLSREEASFPAPAPLPTQTAQTAQPAAQTPAPVQAPAAPSISQASAFAPPPAMPSLPAAEPAPAAQAAPKTITASGLPNARIEAPAPRARFTPPRASAPRRTTSAPVPRPLGGGDEPAAAPAPAAAPIPEVSDLLGNALKP